MITKDNLQENLEDLILDKGREFFIDDRRYLLYYPTLGMTIEIGRHISNLDINPKAIEKNPFYEALRLCSDSKDKVCMLLALYSFRRKEDHENSEVLKKRAKEFSKLPVKDMASLLILILTDPDFDTLMHFTGLRKEREMQTKVGELKSTSGNSLSFGGKTILGSLIVPACELFHCIPECVVWDIPLLVLRLCLADKITSLYLTDEEAKKLKIRKNDGQVFGMTKEDIEKLKSMDCWA